MKLGDHKSGLDNRIGRREFFGILDGFYIKDEHSPPVHTLVAKWSRNYKFPLVGEAMDIREMSFKDIVPFLSGRDVCRTGLENCQHVILHSDLVGTKLRSEE